MILEEHITACLNVLLYSLLWETVTFFVRIVQVRLRIQSILWMSKNGNLLKNHVPILGQIHLFKASITVTGCTYGL